MKKPQPKLLREYKIFKEYTISFVAGIAGGLTVVVLVEIVKAFISQNYKMLILWFIVYAIGCGLIYTGGHFMLLDLFKKEVK